MEFWNYLIIMNNFVTEKSLRRKEPEIIILGKNQVKNGKGPHHGIRGTAWTGRVTSPWEPDSVKPGGFIKITIKKDKIGVDQYKKTLEPTKSKTLQTSTLEMERC